MIHPRLFDYQQRMRSNNHFVANLIGHDGSARQSGGLVSVVTVTYNSAATIDRTIESVSAQTYASVEYIVVDGGSTDGTTDRLRARSHEISYWISEPDRGISDAFNKGVASSHGQYIAIVNSDDWMEPSHLAVAVRELADTEADFVYGDLMLHGVDGVPVHLIVGERDYSKSLRHNMPHINHPTVVCKRDAYERCGLFDTSLSIAMDYEWFLRGFQLGIRGKYVPGLMAHMTLAGRSDVQSLKALKEVREVSVSYGYPRLWASSRYLIRCAKTQGRRALQQWLPAQWFEWARRRINRHYRTVRWHSP